MLGNVGTSHGFGNVVTICACSFK